MGANIRILSAGASTVCTASVNGIQGTSAPFTVQAGPLGSFAFDVIPVNQPQPNAPFPVTLRATDGYGNALTSFAGSASLKAWQDGGQTTIGSGTDSVDDGCNTTYDTSRLQMLFTSAEIGRSGRIHGLGLELKSPPGRAFTNFTVRVKHGTLGYLTSAWDNSGFTITRQGALDLTQAKGWVEIPFTAPFDYDGTSTLVVDIAFSNTGLSVSGGSCFATYGYNSAVAASRNRSAGYGEPETWSGGAPFPNSSYRPNVRLSFGTALTISPATTGNFVNGVWTGDVTIPQAASDVFLTATSGIAVGNSNLFDVGAAPPAAPVMTAEPAFTNSTTNSVAWSAVPKATAYYVEAATDNAFTAPIANSGWITATSYAFTGLVSGTHYYYRVKAQKNSVDGAWSNTVDSTQDATGPVIYLGSTDDGVKTAFITNGTRRQLPARCVEN